MLRKLREGKRGDRGWCWTQGRTAAEREEGRLFGPWFSNGQRPVWAFLGGKKIACKKFACFKWITLPPKLIQISASFQISREYFALPLDAKKDKQKCYPYSKMGTSSVSAFLT